MKKLFLWLVVIIIIPFTAISQQTGNSWFARYVTFQPSVADAVIYVDGEAVGKGSFKVTLLGGKCVHVEVKAPGYVTYHRQLCNNKGSTLPPKTFKLVMEVDEAGNSSVKSDIANNDIEILINKKYSEVVAWKRITMIVTNYFDIVEISDRESGYLRTAWTNKSFSNNTIRSRIIVKQSSIKPLAYKFKFISQQSREGNTSVKDDQLFIEWDRVLKKYDGLFEEINTRLK